MRVVRVRPDRSIETLGECRDFEPPKRPGDVIMVTPSPTRLVDERGRTLPYSIVQASGPRMRYEVRRIVRAGVAETVVEAAVGGPPPRFLPGWRPLAA